MTKFTRILALFCTLAWGGSSTAWSGFNQIEEGTYDGGARRTLRYVLATPRSEEPRRIFIFAAGDGDSCTPFSLEGAKAALFTLSIHGAWVVYESARDALCGTPAYGFLDFYHRVDEL